MNERTAAQKEALGLARLKRKIAVERTAPEGYRSVAHFLDSVRERAGGKADGTQDLANYLGANKRSVRKWLSGEKMPLQSTLDAMAIWMTTKRL